LGWLWLVWYREKASGPNYLLRFTNERTASVNTTAVSGNAALLSLADLK